MHADSSGPEEVPDVTAEGPGERGAQAHVYRRPQLYSPMALDRQPETFRITSVEGLLP